MEESEEDDELMMLLGKHSQTKEVTNNKAKSSRNVEPRGRSYERESANTKTVKRHTKSKGQVAEKAVPKKN